MFYFERPVLKPLEAAKLEEYPSKGYVQIFHVIPTSTLFDPWLVYRVALETNPFQ